METGALRADRNIQLFRAVIDDARSFISEFVFPSTLPTRNFGKEPPYAAVLYNNKQE